MESLGNFPLFFSTQAQIQILARPSFKSGDELHPCWLWQKEEFKIVLSSFVFASEVSISH